MYDDTAADVGVFDFDELGNHLLEQGCDVSPSRLHGCLCGLLAGGADEQAEVGLDAVAQTLDIVFYGELAERIMQLYTVTAAALADDEFTFHPLLPGDDDDIDVRTAALAEWSSGFLVGFAQLRPQKAGGADPLTQDSGEVLSDIAAMAQATVDDGEDDDDNDLEENYWELVEYLRFAVLNVYTDSHIAKSESDSSDNPRPSLH